MLGLAQYLSQLTHDGLEAGVGHGAHGFFDGEPPNIGDAFLGARREALYGLEWLHQV